MTELVKKEVAYALAMGPSDRTRVTVGKSIVDIEGWDRYSQSTGRIFLWRSEAEELAKAIYRLLAIEHDD